jgi:spore coat protein U-like protein
VIKILEENNKKRERHMKNLIITLISVILCTHFAQAQSIHSINATLNSSAKLSGVCTINAQNISLGSIIAGQPSSTGYGNISIQCTKGTSYSYYLSFPSDGTDCPYLIGSQSGDKLYYGILINGTINDLYGPISSTGTGLTQSWTMTGMVTPPASRWNSSNVCKNRTSIYTGVNPYITPDNYSNYVSAIISY